MSMTTVLIPARWSHVKVVERKTHSRPHPKAPGERMRVVADRQRRRSGQPLRRELRPRAAFVDWRDGGRLPPWHDSSTPRSHERTARVPLSRDPSPQLAAITDRHRTLGRPAARECGLACLVRRDRDRLEQERREAHAARMALWRGSMRQNKATNAENRRQLEAKHARSAA